MKIENIIDELVKYGVVAEDALKFESPSFDKAPIIMITNGDEYV